MLLMQTNLTSRRASVLSLFIGLVTSAVSALGAPLAGSTAAHAKPDDR
jgi:hypothetical protein